MELYKERPRWFLQVIIYLLTINHCVDDNAVALEVKTHGPISTTLCPVYRTEIVNQIILLLHFNTATETSAGVAEHTSDRRRCEDFAVLMAHELIISVLVKEVFL